MLCIARSFIQLAAISPEVGDMQDTQINNTSKPIKSLNIFGQPTMIFGVPVDQKTIFSNFKGIYKKSIEKRQRKLIVKTTFIKFFLQTDERIFCLTTGFSPISVLEQVLTNLAFLFFKRVIFVFTEKRLLLVPVRFGGRSQNLISQILYQDCAQMTLIRRKLLVQYKDGRQEKFPYIGLREKKKVKALIESITFEPKVPGPSKSRFYLCPSCTNELADNVSTCPACQLKFKSKLLAMVQAIIVPGGGYFYSRYHLLGIFIALLELMLMGFIATLWIDLKNGQPVGYGMLALLISGLILEKAVVTYHARQVVQHLLPAKNKFIRRKIVPPSKTQNNNS